MHAVWAAERRYLASRNMEDWFFTENSGMYPVQDKQVEALKGTHEVKFVVTCPTDLGFPMRRRRTFSFGFNVQRWEWHGPISQEAIQADFDANFGSVCQLAGDLYLVEADAAIHSFIESTAARRGRRLPADYREKSMRDLLPYLLPPGALVRLGQYEKCREDKQSLDGCFMADLDHNVDCGPAPGPELPSLDTHPNIFSFKAGRLALGSELLAAQGVDMFDCNSGRRGLSPLKPVFDQLGESERRFLAGNGIHIPSFAAWLLYALSNVRLRAGSRVPRNLPQKSTAHAADDGDEQPLKKSKVTRPLRRLE